MEHKHHLHDFDEIIYKSKWDALSEIYNKHILPGEIFIAYYIDNNKICSIMALSANGLVTVVEGNDKIISLLNKLLSDITVMYDKLSLDNCKLIKEINLLNQDIVNINNDIHKHYIDTLDMINLLSLQIADSLSNQEQNMNSQLSWKNI